MNAADAAFVAANQVTNDYLAATLLVTNQVLRISLMRGGVRDMALLLRKNKAFIHTLAVRILKRPGIMANRDVTAELEEDLQALCVWCRYTYITQRPLTLANATRHNITEIHTWQQQLPEDPEPSSVDKFSDSKNKRVWFESIKNYLSVKKGPSGFPLEYIIRGRAALPVIDLGFGQPEFDLELEQRGRLDGHFYKADNAIVWLHLRGLCHGTTAWTLISPLKKGGMAEELSIALMSQCMGPDVQQVLLRNAEHFLERAMFDNQSRQFTWDKFIGKMRQAFQDLGPLDQMSEQRKVTKLMQAWQVSELRHLDAMVTGDPVRTGWSMVQGASTTQVRYLESVPSCSGWGWGFSGVVHST